MLSSFQAGARKMRDSPFRLIFSLIRQQTEMEEGEQGVGKGRILEQPAGTKERETRGAGKLRLQLL